MIFLCTLLLHAAINDDRSSFWHKRILARTWKREALTLFMLCLVLFQLYVFHFILLMLFQMFYLFSITTKIYPSPGTEGLAPGYVFSPSLFLPPLTPASSSPPLPPSVMCFRLFLKSHSGTAGRQSSLVINGADFSTKDMDNDNCMCQCALMLTGGECSQTRRC